jgi:hypothetical protein
MVMPKNKKIKIGLTMGGIGRIWDYGLDQNVVFLAMLLNDAGFDVRFILEEDPHSKNLQEFCGIKLEKYNKNMVRSCQKCDVVLFVSKTPNTKDMAAIKEKGTKIIRIGYGNKFQIFNEAMATNPERANFGFDSYTLADAVWVSPHFERNIPWQKSFIDADIEVCPYIWDPLFFEEKCKQLTGDPRWTPEKNVKSIAIHEPNINALKTCIVPLAIVGLLNKSNPELVENVTTLNTERIRENSSFINYVKSLGLIKKGSFESRRTTPFMACSGVMGLSLFNHAHNGLNYLPLELFRLGYPVVHNSEFFKSAGYFYPEIDALKGSEQLKIAIETHENNQKEQTNLANELIYQYSIKNKKNIDGYKSLIEKTLDS